MSVARENRRRALMARNPEKDIDFAAVLLGMLACHGAPSSSLCLFLPLTPTIQGFTSGTNQLLFVNGTQENWETRAAMHNPIRCLPPAPHIYYCIICLYTALRHEVYQFFAFQDND